MAEFLTPHEVADHLGVATKTLRNWRHRGGGPVFVKLNGHNVRYRRRDIERWLAGRAYTRTHDRAS